MANSMDSEPQSPTQVRWLMFALACGTSWFLYLHRYSWNIIGAELQKQYQYDNTKSGAIFSLFYWTYAAGQIPSGVVIDLMGPHLFLGTSILLWSVALLGFALTGNLTIIGGLRLLFGAAQAGCYPGLTKATRVWFPLSSRTMVQGWVATTFGRAGGAMSTIILATVLMGWCGLSWQLAVILMAGLGIAFSLLFLALFRNSPAEHPHVNQAERDLIAEGADSHVVRSSLSWARAIRSRSLGCFTVQQFLDAGSDVVFVSLIGTYFLRRHGVDIKSAGWLTSLPLWGGALGGIAGGWLNDTLIRVTGKRRWVRSGIGAIGKVIGCLMLFIVSAQTDPLHAGMALMLAKFFSDWSQPTVWGTCTDMGGRCSATVFSIINTAGTVGGVVMPLAFGWMLDANTTKTLVSGEHLTHTNWAPLFLLLAAMYLFSGVSWLLIDCTKSLDDKP